MENYKENVGFVAMLVTMIQMLAGTLICKDIYQKNTSKGIDPMPFLGGIGLCILMLRYALILNDIVMINVNIFGLATNIIYMSVYYYYAPNRKELFKLTCKVTAFVVIFLVYVEIESSANIEFRFGILVTILLLLLIAAPLAHLKQIIKTKNAEILPMPLIIMGTLVSFMWLWYGYLIDNPFIIFQNAIGLMLNIVQVFLFGIYGFKKSQDKLSSKQHKED